VRGLLSGAPADAGLRVSVEKGGCAGMSYKMEIGAARPGDEVVDEGGARVIVDAKAVLFLLGSRMDVKTTKFSSTFVFENPNETLACGCGESVALTPADPSRAGAEAAS
jgi:iron-sulfur cluster assembly protein